MQEINTYKPQTALVLYSTQGSVGGDFIESFSFDEKGFPINAHPLSENEAIELAKALAAAGSMKTFLKPAGLVPENVIHFNPISNGSVTWYTKAGKRNMKYVKSLELTNGEAMVPALLWHATAKRLHIYAIDTKKRPTINTPLYNAPFLNIGSEGLVCMGSVKIKIKEDYSLERFMKDWESYFFDSNFSHAGSSKPTKNNFFGLWKRLHETGDAFPKEELVPCNAITLKKLLK